MNCELERGIKEASTFPSKVSALKFAGASLAELDEDAEGKVCSFPSTVLIEAEGEAEFH